jgi:hypothetical protein
MLYFKEPHTVTSQKTAFVSHIRENLKYYELASVPGYAALFSMLLPECLLSLVLWQSAFPGHRFAALFSMPHPECLLSLVLWQSAFPGHRFARLPCMFALGALHCLLAYCMSRAWRCGNRGPLHYHASDTAANYRGIRF